jgi:serine phosphatase RsbU (regulator of sigma subunit)/tetratricopeptide (TPR) repeat protein
MPMMNFGKYSLFCLTLVCCLALGQVVLAQAKMDELIVMLNKATDDATRAQLCYEIGLGFQRENGHKKALEYFDQALQTKKLDEAQRVKVQQRAAISYLRLNQPGKAIKLYEEVIAYETKAGDKQALLNTSQLLMDAYRQEGQYQKALEAAFKVLQYQTETGRANERVDTYNNIGYLYKQMGNETKAIEFFRNAIQEGQLNSNQSLPADKKATMHLNIGVSHTHLGDYKSAKEDYSKALDIYAAQNLPVQQANVYNYLAVNDYLNRRNDQAISNAQRAVELAEPNRAHEVLQVSYKLLSDFYALNGDIQAAQIYYEKYLQSKDQLQAQERDRNREQIQREMDLERRESDLKLFAIDQERKELELNQVKLEKEKQEQDLALQKQQVEILRRDQELQQAALRNQQLERERVEQLLQITQQQAQAEQQKQAIALLEKNKELQALELEKKEAEEKKQQQARQLLEQENQLQSERVKAANRNQQFAFWIVVLVLAVLILAIIGFVQTRRTARRLKDKNREIESQQQEILTQNEELYQNQEEILAQRDFIEQKNKELEANNRKMAANEQILQKAYARIQQAQEKLKDQNKELEDRDRQIVSSIRSATTIQTAILPYKQKLDSLLGDYFVIYKPKDIVSGDFFWLNEIERKTFLAAVDCTGHGVPGAFMTLIGNTLLDKIIRVWNIFDPAQILTRLHEEVTIMLRQKETKNNNGMDLVLIMVESEPVSPPKEYTISFCGAKNSLYYFLPNNPELQELKGDRKSIGGEQNDETVFTTQTITLPSGSMLYLGSDGIEDQNDAKRKKFGSKRLRALLAEVVDMPTDQQQETIESNLAQHMEGTHQRDDMLLIGVRLP